MKRIVVAALALLSCPLAFVLAVGALSVQTTMASPGAAWTNTAVMPVPRYQLAAAPGKGGTIYVIGGYGYTDTFKRVEMYNPRTNTWRREAPLHLGRVALGAATGLDGTI